MQNTTIQNTYYIGENIVNSQYKDLIDSSKSINKRCDISIVYDDIFELAIIHDDYTYYEVFIKFRDDVSYKVISNYVSNSNFKEILYNIKNKNTLNYNNYYTTITGRNYKNSLEYLSLCLIKNGMVRFYKDPNISNKFYFIFNYATLITNYSSEMLNYMTQYFKDIVGLDECVDIGENVKSIGHYFCYNCSKLQTVIFRGKVTQFAGPKTAFEWQYRFKPFSIYVRDEDMEYYKGLFKAPYNTYIKSITELTE